MEWAVNIKNLGGVKSEKLQNVLVSTDVGMHSTLFSLTQVWFLLMTLRLLFSQLVILEWQILKNLILKFMHYGDMSGKIQFKAQSHRQNFAGAFLERWKKFITARNRSPPFNRSWPPLRQSSPPLQQCPVKVWLPLDASSWMLWSARPTRKSWTLDHRCFASFARAVIKRCTKLWWSGCKRFTSGHGIAGTVSGVEAAIHCGDELWFGVSMEVSPLNQRSLPLNQR